MQQNYSFCYERAFSIAGRINFNDQGLRNTLILV
jgi:hypothetical protein